MNLFPNLKPGKWIELNLNEESKKSNPNVLDPEECENWIHTLEKKNTAEYSYGPFLEDRSYIWKNHPGAKNRNPSLIHLGIDYSVPAGTQVVLPVDGKVVHVMQNKDNSDGWGGRIIWKVEGDKYLIYGHLKKDIKYRMGEICKKGQIIGTVGKSDTNGGWWPHLHVQIINKAFFEKFKDNLEKIDGYLAYNDPLLKGVINPSGYVRPHKKFSA